MKHWNRCQSKAASFNSGGEQLSVGRYLRSLIRGRRDFLNDAEQRAMSEGNNVLGGNVVPSPLSAQIIDRARNLSVIMKAGAKIVEMDSQTLDIARITNDVSYEVKSENACPSR